MTDQNIAHECKGYTPGELKACPFCGADYAVGKADDARLIAEAPNLLAHLKFAVALLGPLCGGTAQVEAMRAAITKAEG